jgi:hypothetical protein
VDTFVLVAICLIIAFVCVVGIFNIELNRREANEKMEQKQREIDRNLQAKNELVQYALSNAWNNGNGTYAVQTDSLETNPYGRSIISGSASLVQYPVTSGSSAPIGFRRVTHVGSDTMYSIELIPIINTEAVRRYLGREEIAAPKKKNDDKVCDHCSSGNSNTRFLCSQCGAPL